MRITIFNNRGHKIGAAYASEPVFANYCNNQVAIIGVNCYKTLEKMNKSYADRR